MGKKRKSEQLEAAQPQATEPKKPKSLPETEQSSLPTNEDKSGALLTTTEPKKKKNRKKKKKPKPVDIDVAGEPLEASKEEAEAKAAEPPELTPAERRTMRNRRKAARQKESKKKKKKDDDILKSTEQKVVEEEEEPINYLQVCVICRQKGHVISTCPLLNENESENNNKESGNKLPECHQPLQHVELMNGEAEKLTGCSPEDTLMKDKSSDCKEGESVVKNGEESCCTPENMVVKVEKSDDREDKTIVKVDSASHPVESYVKPVIEQGPEVVNPVS